MKKLFGLGKGLESLIPKTQGAVDPKSPKESVFMVEVSKISSNPDQPRKDFEREALDELARSIKRYGVLQPLLVAKMETETLRGVDVSYQLIAGERRLRAARIAGLPRVPVVIRDDLPAGEKEPQSERLELALIENLQREDLNPMEEAQAYARLQVEFDLTHKEIADKVGKSREAVANAVRLLNLPDDMQSALQAGKISRTHARALLAFQDAGKQRAMYQQILSGGITSKEVEGLASSEKGGARHQKQKSDHRFIDLQENLKETLKTPVLIQTSGSGGKIIIRFATTEELTKIAKSIID